MELEQREDRSDVERQKAEHPEPSADQATLTTPFASEGLEQVRDSRC